MKRIPSLDGLRAVSISLVVVGHWMELLFHSIAAGAFANLGVRIFFVISGYLITTLRLKEYGENSTIQLREFYARRAFRILPAAIVFMLPVFVIFWHELRWYHMAAAALYLANFDFAHPWFLGHLWSLSVEEQFYFLWPGVLKKMASSPGVDSGGRGSIRAVVSGGVSFPGSAWASRRDVSGGCGRLGDRLPASDFQGTNADD
jgi:peptidoglycan/LPS O-acetylase OafA/YrhL